MVVLFFLYKCVLCWLILMKVNTHPNQLNALILYPKHLKIKRYQLMKKQPVVFFSSCIIALWLLAITSKRRTQAIQGAASKNLVETNRNHPNTWCHGDCFEHAQTRVPNIKTSCARNAIANNMFFYNKVAGTRRHNDYNNIWHLVVRHDLSLCYLLKLVTLECYLNNNYM